jgi:O-antigen ligase
LGSSLTMEAFTTDRFGETTIVGSPRAREVAERNLQAGGSDQGLRSLDLLDIVFLSSAFIAPLDLTIFKSFTIYDLLVTALAFLIIAGPCRMRPLPPHFILASYVFILAGLASTFRASHPVEALTQELQYAFILFLQLPVILTVVRSRFVLRAGVVVFVMGNLFAIATALVFQEASGAGRLQTIFHDNAGRLGQPTAYLLPFVLLFVFHWWRRGRRVAAMVAGAAILYLMIWALAASGSRAGALATVTSLLVFISFRRVNERPRRVVRQFAVAAVMIGVLGVVVYRTEYVPSTLSERVTRTFTPGDELAEDRVDLDVAGLRAFRDSPLIGIGLDNFRFVGWRYGAPSDQAPHNLWIQFLAQVGLVGAAMMLAIIGGWFLLILRAAHASAAGFTQDFLWAFFASGVALMTIYMTAPVMVHRQYWLIIGLGIALALDVTRERSAPTLWAVRNQVASGKGVDADGKGIRREDGIVWKATSGDLGR